MAIRNSSAKLGVLRARPPEIAPEGHAVALDGKARELPFGSQCGDTRDGEPHAAQGERRPRTDLLGDKPHDQPADRHHPPVQGREQADHPAAQPRRRDRLGEGQIRRREGEEARADDRQPGDGEGDARDEPERGQAEGRPEDTAEQSPPVADPALDRLERDAGDEAADPDCDDQRPEPGSPDPAATGNMNV